MKLLKLILPLIAIIVCSTLIAQNTSSLKNDSTVCLQLIGLATERSIPIDGVIVKLYKENEEMLWEEITSVVYHEHSFSFDLNRNCYYTVEISKPGYVTRSVGISTKLPDDIKTNDVKFTFEFEVELFKEKKDVDDYYLDFPVALINFNELTQVFEYDTKYTKHIKSKINETTKTSSSNVKSK